MGLNKYSMQELMNQFSTNSILLSFFTSMYSYLPFICAKMEKVFAPFSARLSHGKDELLTKRQLL